MTKKSIKYSPLKHPPLIEAILDLRWELKNFLPGIKKDPNFKILTGRFFDRVSKDYPYYEGLDTVSLPEEIIANVVQHRFRCAKDEWPLVQIGPGVLSINETTKYKKEDFLKRCKDGVNFLFNSYPKPEELKVTSLQLRYINSVDFDYSKNNTFEFLKNKMALDIDFSDNLFKDSDIGKSPSNLTFQTSFNVRNPNGILIIKFGTGQQKEVNSLIWEITFNSSGDFLPEIPDEFENWIIKAHNIIEDWFFKLIDGELLRRFKGE